MSFITLNLPRGARFDNARTLVKRVDDLVTALGGRWSVEFKLPATRRAAPRTLGKRKSTGHSAQPTVAEVIGYVTLGTSRMPARDMFEVTDAVRRQLATQVVDRFIQRATREGNVPNAGALMTTIAFGLRDLVVQRWESGGGGLPLAPLSASHLARKIALGYPTKIGTMTGQSLQALRRAQPIARRTG